VVAKLKERLAVHKQVAQKFVEERFNIRKLNELEVRKQYHIQISERFAALDKLSDSEDINRAWENIKGLHELKQHKHGLMKKNVYVFRTKEAGKNAVSTGSKQKSVDNLNNIRRQASRHFRNKIGISES